MYCLGVPCGWKNYRFKTGIEVQLYMDNLAINWGSFNGEEYAELTYVGYHSEEHIIWDATSDFYNKVKNSILDGLVNPKCTDCAAKSSETHLVKSSTKVTSKMLKSH